MMEWVRQLGWWHSQYLESHKTCSKPPTSNNTTTPISPDMGGKWFIPRPQDAPSGRFMVLGESHIAEVLGNSGIRPDSFRPWNPWNSKTSKNCPKNPHRLPKNLDWYPGMHIPPRSILIQSYGHTVFFGWLMDDLNYAVVKPMEDISCISHKKTHEKHHWRDASF